MTSLQLLFVEPDHTKILIDIVTGAHLPAFDVASIWHNTIAPQQEDFVRLGVEDQLFEFSHQLTLAREIGLPQHAVVEFDLCWILLASKIRTRDSVRQVFGPIEQRVDDVLAFAIERRIEFALP